MNVRSFENGERILKDFNILHFWTAVFIFHLVNSYYDFFFLLLLAKYFLLNTSYELERCITLLIISQLFIKKNKGTDGHICVILFSKISLTM